MFSLCHYVVLRAAGQEKNNLLNPFWIQAVTTKCGISQGVWILSEGTVYPVCYGNCCGTDLSPLCVAGDRSPITEGTVHQERTHFKIIFKSVYWLQGTYGKQGVQSPDYILKDTEATDKTSADIHRSS